MEAESSVPEGWMVEKDELGTESFLSPDGTSVASRRLGDLISYPVQCPSSGQYFKFQPSVISIQLVPTLKITLNSNLLPFNF